MGLAGPLTASRTTARGKASVVHRRKYSHGRYCRTKHPCRYRTSMLALPFVTKNINLRHCLVYRISIRPSSSQFVGALLVRLVSNEALGCFCTNLHSMLERDPVARPDLIHSPRAYFRCWFFRGWILDSAVCILGCYRHFCGRSPNPPGRRLCFPDASLHYSHPCRLPNPGR